MTEMQNQDSNQPLVNQEKYHKVISGIKIPEKRRRGKWLLLVLKMKPGDSTLVRNAAEATALYKAFKNLGIKCESRKAMGGIRFWMIGGE
jgi:hypothetical protein